MRIVVRPVPKVSLTCVRGTDTQKARTLCVPLGDHIRDRSQPSPFPEISKTLAGPGTRSRSPRETQAGTALELPGTLLPAKSKNNPISHIRSTKQKQKRNQN